MHKIQKKILKLAETDDISVYGYRKLGDKVGVDHPQKVKWHLQKLINDGYLARTNDGKLKVVEENDTPGLAKVPILGMANCGEPLAFADNNIHDYLSLSPSLLKSGKLKSLFAIKAVGDSMNSCSVNGQSIDDGDYVIVDSSVETPSTNDVIVSSVEGLANVKRYVRDEANQVIALVSDSTRQRPPIFIDPSAEDSYKVHGRVVQVLKAGIY